jgi:hypothetical protein
MEWGGREWEKIGERRDRWVTRRWGREELGLRGGAGREENDKRVTEERSALIPEIQHGTRDRPVLCLPALQGYELAPAVPAGQ